MSFYLLSLVRPFVPILPDVKSPGRQIYFQEKLVWTMIALLIFLVSSQVPLFGIMSSDTADPLYWMRMMMASSRGTLMDIGISPILSSSMIIQGLCSSGILVVDYNVKEDKILYHALQKLLALIITLGQAVVQVMTGFYGNPKSLGFSVCFILVAQLIFSGIIVILLDEMLSKGYGMGSGVNLFIAANVCESIVWKALSPKVFNTARGIEFEGSLVNFVHLLFTRKNKINAIYESFFRQNLPNLFSLASTVLIFFVVIYLYGMRVELPIESTTTKGQVGRWPIKLFYASTSPIFFQNYVISYTSIISKFLFNKFPNFLLVRLLGVWEMNVYRKVVPISGICYYIFPPDNLLVALQKPFYFTVYLTIMVLFSAFFSRAYIDFNDLNEASVAKQIKNQKMTLKGVREQNMVESLSKYIPTAAFLGGLIIGTICVFSNILDTIGSGTNIILAVGIMWQYFEAFSKETMKKGGVVFAG
ncbi:translocon subunit [Gurleya vavrai]